MNDNHRKLLDDWLNLWESLTRPRSANADEARREYMTKVISLIMSLVAGGLTCIFGVGWLFGVLPIDSLLITFVMTTIFGGGWWLAHFGRWNVAGYLPPGVIFLTAVYGNCIGGIGAPAMVLYALAIALTATLQSERAQWIPLLLSVGAYVAIGGAIRAGYIIQVRFPETAFANRAVIVVGTYLALASLLWLLGSQFRLALMQARAYAEQLAAANRELAQEITEHKHTEESLRQSEEKYRRLIETTDTGFVIIDDRGNVLDANPRYVRLTGHQALAEIVGHNVLEWTDEEARERNRAAIKQCFAQGFIRNLEVEYRNESGHVTPIEINATVVQTDAGVQILTLCRDITARKRAEEALREAHARLKATLDALPDLMFEVDRHGRIYDYRAPHLEKLYASPQQFLGKTVREVLPEPAASIITNALVEAVEHDEYHGAVYFLEMPTGITWFELSLAAKGDPKSPEGRFVVLARDISERKRAEEALAEKHNLLQMLIDSTPDHIYLKDRAHRFLIANQATIRVIGAASLEDLVGKTDVDFHPPDRVRQYLAEERLVMESGQPMINREACLTDRATGATRWVLTTKVPLRDKQGNVTGLVGFNRDITERTQIDEEIRRLNAALEQRVAERTAELQESLERLKNAQKQLVESEKMAALGTLVAGIAHEINTPVGVGVTAASYLDLQTKQFVAQYAADTLKRSDLEHYVKVAAESAAIILGNLNRAAQLIKSFKRVAVDQSFEEKRRFHLKDYLADILLSLRPHLKKTPHTVTVACAEHLAITSYPGAFSQIISNLIMNSLIHGFDEHKKGEIIIAVSMDERSFHLSYRDNGKGIANEHLPKIFEPFFTTKRTQNSTGLGLYIVYNLVTKQLNGTISCESTPGKGVTFYVEIPVADLEVSGVPGC